MPLTDNAETIGQGKVQDPLQQFFRDANDKGVVFVSPKSTGVIALIAAFVIGAIAGIARSLSAK